ncbi:methyltransferase [Candidatus Micrarchaeota archaeon]|nr:methyltransferase [Candidatus Micrarchaeota archaeon]MBU1930271.1 methyltransferase [Candidatus Micrarchaeota archaeon]
MPQKVFFKQLELDVLESVYTPQEDSFLLAEHVRIPTKATVLDLGCGTGIQGLNAALQGASRVVCTDINPMALKNAKQNASKNGFEKNFVFQESDLFSGLPPDEQFDCIIFNPPYVSSEKNKKWIETDGGKKGREVLDRFLESFGTFLKENGMVFFVQSSVNGLVQTEKKLKQLGFLFEIIARKKLFFEELVVFKVEKNH